MKRVFVVGSPRSGTTWVQLLLAQHPEIATVQETHLFARYLAGLWGAWQREENFRARDSLGISDLMSTEEFLGLCRDFSDQVLERIATRRPDATTVVEKTPGHVLQAPLIQKLYPSARFIHVVRDPRAVVASLRKAGHGWGDRWAPTGVLSCTELWHQHVEAGLKASHQDERWLTIKYEALLENCPGSLSDIFSFLRLDASTVLCREACESCRIERLKNQTPPAQMPWQLEDEPDGFFGPGEAASWREELSASEIRRIEFTAREMMRNLGYERLTSGRFRPFTSLLRAGLGRIKNLLDHHVRGIIKRL